MRPNAFPRALRTPNAPPPGSMHERNDLWIACKQPFVKHVCAQDMYLYICACDTLTVVFTPKRWQTFRQSAFLSAVACAVGTCFFAHVCRWQDIEDVQRNMFVTSTCQSQGYATLNGIEAQTHRQCCSLQGHTSCNFHPGCCCAF